MLFSLIYTFSGFILGSTFMIFVNNRSRDKCWSPSVVPTSIKYHIQQLGSFNEYQDRCSKLPCCHNNESDDTYSTGPL